MNFDEHPYFKQYPTNLNLISIKYIYKSVIDKFEMKSQLTLLNLSLYEHDLVKFTEISTTGSFRSPNLTLFETKSMLLISINNISLEETSPPTNKRYLLFRFSQKSGNVDLDTLKSVSIRDCTRIGIINSQNTTHLGLSNVTLISCYFNLVLPFSYFSRIWVSMQNIFVDKIICSFNTIKFIVAEGLDS